MDPPAWFKKISPTLQVPLLKADDTPIFESMVINEFINEISPKNLHRRNIPAIRYVMGRLTKPSAPMIL